MRHLGGRAVLATAASEMAGRQVEQNRGYATPETLQLELVGVIPKWLESENTLTQHRGDMSRSEKRASLEPVIEFNHILREIIALNRPTVLLGAVAVGEAMQAARIEAVKSGEDDQHPLRLTVW